MVLFLTIKVRSCQPLPGTAAGTTYKGEARTCQKVKLAALELVIVVTLISLFLLQSGHKTRKPRIFMPGRFRSEY